MYDIGETTYTRNELESGFDKRDVDLVVTSEIGPLDTRGNTIRARSIQLNTDIVGGGNAIRLRAQNNINISGQTLQTRGQSITITAGESGPGQLIASNVNIDTNQGVTLNSNGDMRLDGASIIAGNSREARANLATDSTLFVEGLTVSDKNDRLRYSPDGIEVLPMDSNDVEPN